MRWVEANNDLLFDYNIVHIYHHGCSPSPSVGNIWAVLIVWRIKGKIIRTVLCIFMYLYFSVLLCFILCVYNPAFGCQNPIKVSMYVKICMQCMSTAVILNYKHIYVTLLASELGHIGLDLDLCVFPNKHCLFYVFSVVVLIIVCLVSVVVPLIAQKDTSLKWCIMNVVKCWTLVSHWLAHHQYYYYYSTLVEERSIAISLSVCVSVCLSMSISLEPLDRSSQNVLCRSPVAMAWSSSGGVEICYHVYLWSYGWRHIWP